MLFQIMSNIDIRKYANSEQPKIFRESTTAFSSIPVTLINKTVTASRGSVLRPEVTESLERSMREHGSIWAELAKQ